MSIAKTDDLVRLGARIAQKIAQTKPARGPSRKGRAVYTGTGTVEKERLYAASLRMLDDVSAVLKSVPKGTGVTEPTYYVRREDKKLVVMSHGVRVHLIARPRGSLAVAPPIYDVFHREPLKEIGGITFNSDTERWEAPKNDGGEDQDEGEAAKEAISIVIKAIGKTMVKLKRRESRVTYSASPAKELEEVAAE